MAIAVANAIAIAIAIDRDSVVQRINQANDSGHRA